MFVVLYVHHYPIYFIHTPPPHTTTITTTPSPHNRVLLRHDDVSLLQQLQSMPLVVERTLSTPIKVPVYKSHGDALLGKNAVKDVTLLKGVCGCLWACLWMCVYICTWV